MRYRLPTAVATLVVGLSAWLSATPTQAGIPVVDTGNLVQSTISAIEETAQTFGQITQITKQTAQYSKQLEQYSKQVQQFEKQQKQFALQQDQYGNMLLHTAIPDSFIWDNAESTVDGLIDSIDTLSYYQGSMGSVDAYLEEFRDVTYYKSSPCFSAEGCSETEMSAIRQNQELSSESQKKANDAVFKGLARQQTNLERDAERLATLQAAAQRAKGRLEALQYSNQFASQEVNQLLQIRALLMAQQNAQATELQALTNQRAQEQASAVRLRKGRYQTSPTRTW